MWWRLTLPCPPELEESLVWKLTDLGLHRHAVQHAPETPDRKTLSVWLPKPEWPEPQRQELFASLQPLAEPFGLSLPDGHWDDVADEDAKGSDPRGPRGFDEFSIAQAQHLPADYPGHQLPFHQTDDDEHNHDIPAEIR